jgi:hypothetical protein
MQPATSVIEVYWNSAAPLGLRVADDLYALTAVDWSQRKQNIYSLALYRKSWLMVNPGSRLKSFWL